MVILIAGEDSNKEQDKKLLKDYINKYMLLILAPDPTMIVFLIFVFLKQLRALFLSQLDLLKKRLLIVGYN